MADRIATGRPAAEFDALLQRARSFIDAAVIPREDLRSAHDGAALERTGRELRALAER